MFIIISDRYCDNFHHRDLLSICHGAEYFPLEPSIDDIV